MCRRGACGDGGCAGGVWKGCGIGRVCRAGGCVWKSEEKAGVVVRRLVSHGGQAGCRMPGLEMGAGCAGEAREAGEVGGVELGRVPEGGLCGTDSSRFSDGVVAAGAGRAWRRPFYLRQQVLWAGLLNLRQKVLRAGGLYRIASLHSTYVSCRFGFSSLAATVSRQPHMCGTKAGKADFRLWPNPLFLLFVYLRYFCRDTALATGSNSS